MKKLILATLILSFASLASCSKSDTDTPPAPELKTDVNSLAFPLEGGTKEVKITSNVDWKVVEVGEGVTVTPLKGKGNATLSVTMAKNEALEEITKSFKVKSATLSVPVTITQAAKGMQSLGLSPNALSFEIEELTKTFDIDSDGDWEITGMTETVKVDFATGSGKKTITVTVTPNTIYEAVITTLTVKTKVGTKELPLTVTQVAKGLPSLVLSTNALSFEIKDLTKMFEIDSDGDWEITGMTETVKVDLATGNGKKTITVTVTPNTTYEAVTTTLTVKTKVGTKELPLTVTQVARTEALIYVPIAGGLSALLEATQSLKAEPKLKITGTMNADDFVALRVATKTTLQSLDISKLEITELPLEALSGITSLASITLPAELKTIGDRSFYGCTSLTSITLSAGLKTIGIRAFYECTSLKSITIPDGVTAIGNYAFWGCTSLASITIPDGVTAIGGSAFSNCTSLASIIIPAGVTAIGNHAFDGCTSLKSIAIPDGVTSIESYTFWYCTSLASITLPAGLKTIMAYAFSDCTSLASITLPAGLKTIMAYAFSACTSLASIIIPAGMTSIEEAVFYNCTSLASIIIPAGVTAIGNHAFDGCTSLKSIAIPDGVTSIESYTFWYCTSLASITLPAGLKTIMAYAFSDCTSLASITLPAGLKTIMAYAFSACTSLASIIIPAGMTSIEEAVFYNCTSLASIIIPAGVTEIGSYAFLGCASLKDVRCLATTPPVLSSGVFKNTHADKTLKVPLANVITYKASTAWTKYFPVEVISGI